MRARAVVPLLALSCVLSLLSAAFFAAPSPSPLAGVERGTVVRVVDGDTVHVRVGERVEKVRYIGINAPETNHPTRGEEPGGRAATEVNGRLVADRAVRLEPDVQLRDRYGRLLAYVWVNGPGGALMVNAELVRLGYAQVMTVPPNVRHADLFRKLQADAREQRRGLWAP